MGKRVAMRADELLAVVLIEDIIDYLLEHVPAHKSR